MAGAFIIGHLIGSGMILTALFLYALLQGYIALAEHIGVLLWKHRQRHPINKARGRRIALVFYSFLAVLIFIGFIQSNLH
jgi:hypothetical protein